MAFGCAALGVFGPLDQTLRDWRFRLTDRAPSHDTVFLEIDSASLAAIGTWPWPRQIYAQILDRLTALGAAEVVFDIDFSSASTEAGDAALEAALERAGGYAYLAAFQQIDADGRLTLNRPLPRFARFSDPVLVNVDGDGTGLLLSVPSSLPEQAIPSVARVLAPQSNAPGPSITIDFGIDLNAIKRLPVEDLLEGSDLPPDLFQNKQVVIGATAIELRDFFRVPRFGVVPGPLVQLAATETLKAGRSLNDLGVGPGAIVACLATLLFLTTRRQRPVWQVAIGAAVIGMLAELFAWLLLRDGRIVIDISVVHASLVALTLLSVMEDRAHLWRRSRRQRSRLRYLARHDTSTGAFNREAFLDTQRGGKADIVVLQLLRFDGVATCLGHHVAERVAGEVKVRLAKLARSKPARLNADSFALPWSGDLQPLLAFLDIPILADGHSVILGMALGVAAFDSQIPDAERLRRAEIALLKARQSGKDVVHFEASQSAEIEQRRSLDIALRQAVVRQEFLVLFQPQVDLKTGRLLGAEALVRWQNPTLGMVSPARFIPLAEETGLIVELGDWVMQQSCRQAAHWHPDLTISVNVSAVQFKLADVAGSVQRAVAISGLSPHRLVIEITESLFVDNAVTTVAALETLRAMGCTIALDDFGTGYSSLSYLARLPVDEIKIDQSFVRALPDLHHQAIVETIVLMAKRLGKVVVAEGVETDEQRAYLAGIGCDVAQGYLFGRPGDAAQMLAYQPGLTAA